MKYKTTIELICDAADKEEASYTAGEYLRGTIDSGIAMRCKTVALTAHRVAKYGISTVIAVLFMSALVLNIVSFNGDSGAVKANALRIPGTYTVQPELSTGGKSEFKKDWEKKKEEAILDYIKN